MKAILISVALFTGFGDYESTFHQALKGDVPFVLGIGFMPKAPAYYTESVESFKGAETGDTVVLIPYKGIMYRVYCKIEEIESTRKSWQLPDALDECNRRRARLGLRPFIRDDGLMSAASAAAKFRAARLMHGHTSNDFSFLPSGCSASSAGCAAWEPFFVNALIWGSCCSDDNYTYAGAGYAWGSDGRKYMHLFVR